MWRPRRKRGKEQTTKGQAEYRCIHREDEERTSGPREKRGRKKHGLEEEEDRKVRRIRTSKQNNTCRRRGTAVE